MRTKTLLLSAAALAAGLITSSAQVYSVNVVGYVNLTLTNGFNLVANPLDASNGSNTVYSVMGTNLPNLTRVYGFDTSSGNFVFATLNASSGTWLNADALAPFMDPGQGFWVNIPASASYPQTVTAVGNVKQGTLTTPIGALYQLASSQVPQAGGVQTDLGYTPANLDRVYQWLPDAQAYGSPKTYNLSQDIWLGGEPTVAVGESFWLQGHAGSAWTRNFTVQ